MSIKQDDWRLSAWALNEHDALTDDDKQEIEAALQDNAELQQAVCELRAAAGLMKKTFAMDTLQTLSKQQRDKVLKNAAPKASLMVLFRPLAVAGIAIAVAMALLAPMTTSASKEADESMHLSLMEPPAIKNGDSYQYSSSDGSAHAYMSIAGEEHGVIIEKPEKNNYNAISDNGFKDLRIQGNDFSTFSIDVDTASYSDVRSHLQQYGRLPMRRSVRIEEMINYFDYHYAGPDTASAHPFRYHVESSICPWQTKHRLLRIGIQGKRIAKADRPATRLVFLLDVSGSMSNHNKLGLLKQAFSMLVKQLDERDQVAIVTYAGSSGLVLAPTSGDNKQTILDALNRLNAGGSTNGAGGIQQAYSIAQDMFKQDAENRVILATDGDFNVGISDQTSLVEFIKQKAQSGIFLNIHGYGMSNRQDGTMEAMSNNGNGTYAYIDNIREAQKVMVDDLTGSLVTIAKDVKIQCVFNPQHVAAWRLIGYENRLLKKEDFNNDTKDAGEIGAGHNVTAIYEIIPAGTALPKADVDPSPFIKQEVPAEAKQAINASPAWLQLRLRYKAPQGQTSMLLQEDVVIHERTFAETSSGFRWAASIAAFGMQLRQSPHKGDVTWSQILEMARKAKGPDQHGHRAECIRLIEMAQHLEQ